MIAAQEGHFPVVMTLLAVDAAIAARETEFFQTVLHFAVTGGHDGIAMALLRAGAGKDSQDAFGQTPLITLAGHGHLPFVEALLTTGASLSLECVNTFSLADDPGCTAIHVAASEGHDGAVIALFRGGAHANEQDKNQQTPLYMAARGGHLSVVENLVEADANPNARSVEGDSKSALDHAASLGHVLMIKPPVDGGADVNAHHRGRSALHFAGLNDRPGAIAALIEAGGETELKMLSDEYAAEESVIAAVDRRSGSTPLLSAASGARGKAMEVLLQHGAAVNAQDDNGHSPLHLVCAASRRADAEEAVAILAAVGS